MVVHVKNLNVPVGCDRVDVTVNDTLTVGEFLDLMNIDFNSNTVSVNGNPACHDMRNKRFSDIHLKNECYIVYKSKVVKGF